MSQTCLASFSKRLIALCIDLVLLFMAGTFVINQILDSAGLALKSSLPVWCLLIIVYFLACEASPLQATLGKRVMRLRVVDKQGERLPVMLVVLRSVAKFLLLPNKPNITLNRFYVIHLNSLPKSLL